MLSEKASETMHVHTPIKVRYGETDMMGVVYHANYLLYFEDARIDFLNAAGYPYDEYIEQAGYMSPIYGLEIQYRSPLRYGEDAFVRTSVAQSLPMRTVYRQQVFHAEDAAGVDETGEPLLRDGATPLVDGLVTLCVVERDTFKPVSLKRTFPDLYRLYGEIIEES